MQVQIENTQVQTVQQIVEKVVEVPKVQVFTQDNVVVQERIKVPAYGDEKIEEAKGK